MKLQGKNGTTCLQMLTVSLRGRGGAYSPYTLVKLTVKKSSPLYKPATFSRCHCESFSCSSLKEDLCNLFSIFHLICFSHFQSQIIFPSPALQLFSRITSPPFMISLAKLYFAKSKARHKKYQIKKFDIVIDIGTGIGNGRWFQAHFLEEWLTLVSQSHQDTLLVHSPAHCSSPPI